MAINKNPRDGKILLIAGGVFLVASILLWIWAWGDGWTALPVTLAVVTDVGGLILGGFGIAKLV